MKSLRLFRTVIALGLMLILSSASGQEAEPLNPNDPATFDVIVSGNIFDPNRGTPPTARPDGAQEDRREEPPPRRDQIVLHGVLISETNAYGFFDGTDSEYRRVIPVNEKIGGLTLTRLTSASVVLSTGTNDLELRVSDGIERVGEEPWRVVAAPGRIARDEARAASDAGDSAAAVSGESGGSDGSEATGTNDSGGMSDVLKRLLEKRRKEAEQ